MNQWRVYNEHTQGLTFRQVFKEKEIIIPAGQFVLMDYEEAVEFKSAYFPMTVDAQGEPDPRSWKMISIKPHSEESAVPEITKKYVCPVDGREFQTQTELDAYQMANFSHLNVKDEMLDNQIEKSKKRAMR